MGDATISKGPGAGFVFTSGISTLTYLGIGVGTGTSSTPLNVALGSSGAAKVIVSAHASQSVNMMEWQNSSGTVKSSINASGSLELNGKDIELMTIMGAF